jgi:hypothetical protein
MSQYKTKRLTRDNEKTNNSYQNKLSPKEIKEKLEEYKRVNDISKVALDAHLRYFTINDKGEKLFRLGGFLRKIDLEKGYVILSNVQLNWSFQIKNSIFFQKMSFQDLKVELKEEIEKKYLVQMKKIVDENKKLKNALKDIKNQATKNKKKSSKKKSSKKNSK